MGGGGVWREEVNAVCKQVWLTLRVFVCCLVSFYSSFWSCLLDSFFIRVVVEENTSFVIYEHRCCVSDL